MGRAAPVDIYYLKAPPLKGKHKITQHLAFVAVFFSFFSKFFFFVPLTSWYHILGRRCVSISIVSNWNKCKLLFFFFSKVVVGDLVFGSGARSLDNIFTTGSRSGCTHLFSFSLRRRQWSIYLRTSFWLPLSGNHIHWHSHEKKKARILAYWLSRKETREVGLTAVSQQLLMRHSCPELPRGTGGDYKWMSDTINRTYHSLFFSW